MKSKDQLIRCGCGHWAGVMFYPAATGCAVDPLYSPKEYEYVCDWCGWKSGAKPIEEFIEGGA